MANDLASYIASLDLTLATAIDSTTWTDALLTDAIRQAIHAYDKAIVYESSFTVTTAGYSQDFSAVTDLLDIIAIAWPWSDGQDFDHLRRKFRYYDHQKLYVQPAYPAVDDVIRLRHTKTHHLKDLDAAAATTIPTEHAHIVNLAAAAWSCTLRTRQVTENPALPLATYTQLSELVAFFTDQFLDHIAAANPQNRPAWPRLGLD